MAKVPSIGGDFGQGAEWQSLIPETFSNSHEINSVGDCGFDLDDMQDDFLDLDQWLDQNYFTGDSADLDREQAPDLAPPLYTTFSEPEKETFDKRSTRQEEQEKPSEASVPALSSLVQKLQLDLDDKTRKLDLLAEYLEQLQPWIEDISSNVHSLISQDSQHPTTSVDEPCNLKGWVGLGEA